MTGGCMLLDPPPVAHPTEGVLEPDTACTYDSFDCNPAVHDVIGQIASLRQRGVALGFNPGAMTDPPTRWRHWQSIQRMAGAYSNYLLLTRAKRRARDAVVEVVRLASCGTDGGRLRSNRRIRGGGTTAPPATDVVVDNVYARGAHPHAGGAQLAGKVLAVPLEGHGLGSRVELFDLSNPVHATSIGVVSHDVPGGTSDEAGTAALAKLVDGTFVLVIGRRNVRTLDFYQSTTTDIRATGWQYLDTWHARELRTTIEDRRFGSYQNLQLIAGTDQRLYLVGTHQQGIVRATQWVDLFVVTGSRSVTITKVAKRRVQCRNGGVQCNLDAGAGVYIDPAGALIVYGVEHEHGGPRATGPHATASVRLTEF
jgi:hypothetical protein